MVFGEECTVRDRGHMEVCLVENARSPGQKRNKYKEVLESSDDASDNDRFRTSRWTAHSDNMMIMEKDPDTAKRDLHLEVSGDWASTLFPELYGITESLLLSPSQVIRTANERDITINQNAGCVLGLREFVLASTFPFGMYNVDKIIFPLKITPELDTCQVS